MRKTKANKLKAAGWKVGSTSSFLKLSAEEEAFVEIRLALANYLKMQRRKRHLTQTQLAKAIESSQSRVAKMEAGDPSVTVDLLIRSLLALGASVKQLGRIIEATA